MDAPQGGLAVEQVRERGGNGDAQDQDGSGRRADAGCAWRTWGGCGDPGRGCGAEGEEVRGVEGDADDERLQDASGDVGVIGPSPADGGPDRDPDDAGQHEDDEGEDAEGVRRDVHVCGSLPARGLRP